ncbi:MAG: bifunctional aconitate hydratase 2/2-methylisocitrate dehydratase [Planctomycetes bacterium]|nr:bifunctional aconitate hydratase 2/2-methylisocitrate dehydratase [Planctomycetota bacterium]
MNQELQAYEQHVKDREEKGIPPLALTRKQSEALIKELKESSDTSHLLYLLKERINPGVDPAAECKALFLKEVALNELSCNGLDADEAISLLGTMMGGYNITALLELLSLNDEKISPLAAEALQKTLLVYDSYESVEKIHQAGNNHATKLIESWAQAEWFTSAPEVPESFKLVVYKVNGEINTDDFSPASEAFTRADIPNHAKCMGGSLFPNGPNEIAELKGTHNLPIAFVGDVVGTGSSRKSACNSLLWHIGEDIPFVPNKRRGGIILGGIIAPIFFNTAEDSGALPIEVDVNKLSTGQVIEVNLKDNGIFDDKGAKISSFNIKPSTLLDEYRAGGRVPLLIGKDLSEKARATLKLGSIKELNLFSETINPSSNENQGFTLAQKMVGKACGVKGILPGSSCLPKMTTVGSQDTTGPMTASEMTELACLKFQADLVMQSFCHTAAYPKPADIITHNSLPEYISSRKGVALKPGDGVIHSWLNRLLIPDTVGTGGDSHTRFPLGISFPAGSGLVAFAAALGRMPLDMPESVLVRFKGSLNKGITLRDVVNAIPYYAIKEGLLTVEKKGKVNVFSGKILEMEGLPHLKVEQAFELTDAAAERSAAAATIKLDREPIVEYLNSNIKLMETMICKGYSDSETLKKRISDVQDWIENGELMSADKNADYAAIIEIDLADIKEPILCCPNDPDDVKLLSEVAGDRIDEAFIGSCMTNIGHFRAAGTILKNQGQAKSQLWVCPPTRMDSEQLTDEGYYATFAAAGSRIEVSGCSLCMGNQARVRDATHVMSTSTRNFNNRMGKDARVYLGSAELTAVTALLGKLPTFEEYLTISSKAIEGQEESIYQYLNFHQMDGFDL